MNNTAEFNLEEHYNSKNKTISIVKISIKTIPHNLCSVYPLIRKVIIRHANIVDITPLCKLPSLCHLDVSSNCIYSIQVLETISETCQLTVLDVSHNLLTSLSGISKQSGLNIQALIASDNKLGDVSALSNIGEKLNTLVLSNNKLVTSDIKDESKARQETRKKSYALLELISHKFASSLRKLSLTKTGLTHISDKLSLPLLNELKLAHNEITHFPLTICLRSLKICDISHNKFNTLMSLKPSKYIENLSICGNPIVQSIALTRQIATDKNTQAHLSAFLRKVKRLDGVPFKALTRADGEAMRERIKQDRSTMQSAMEPSESTQNQKVNSQHNSAPFSESHELEDKLLSVEPVDNAHDSDNTPQYTHNVTFSTKDENPGIKRGSTAALCLKPKNHFTPW